MGRGWRRGDATDSARVASPDPELLVHHLEEGVKAIIALAADGDGG